MSIYTNVDVHIHKCNTQIWIFIKTNANINTWFRMDSKAWFSRLFQNFICEKYTIFPEHKPEKYTIFPENNILSHKINKFIFEVMVDNFNTLGPLKLSFFQKK